MVSYQLHKQFTVKSIAFDIDNFSFGYRYIEEGNFKGCCVVMQIIHISL
jgi:hypothetical protein